MCKFLPWNICPCFLKPLVPLKSIVQQMEGSKSYLLTILCPLITEEFLCLVDPSRWVFSIEFRKIHLRKLSLYSPNSSSISPFWSVITASKVFSIIAIPASWAFFAVAVVSSWVSLVVHPFNSSSHLSYYVGKGLKGLYTLLISVNSVANSSPWTSICLRIEWSLTSKATIRSSLVVEWVGGGLFII